MIKYNQINQIIMIIIVKIQRNLFYLIIHKKNKIFKNMFIYQIKTLIFKSKPIVKIIAIKVLIKVTILL